jgi:glycosyltransferase involved in cell wall biosynthesis
MKLCLLGKYPPIQGGVSSQMYWLSRAVAELGHEVHCVTNADEVETAYRMYVPRAERPRLECRLSGGGSVAVHMTCEPRSHSHIPYANPFVTKLAALAADVVTKYGCEIIYTSYFEPYGFAGALASRWTGVPFTVKHAGSDIGRLAQMPERARAYRELLREADLVLTAAPLVRALLQVGVDFNRIHLGLPAYWPQEFTPHGPVLDVAALLEEVRSTEFASPTVKVRPYDPNLPTIGMYGKPGKLKGTSDLIDALCALHQRGKDFNLIFLCGVAGDVCARVLDSVRRGGIEPRTYMLPFLPHWVVPQVLRACTAMCVLENRFPIAMHQPATALEVLACGTCLVLSEEIRAKQWKSDQYRDHENFLSVRDPRDIPALATTLDWIIDHPEDARGIGSRGACLFEDAAERGNAKAYEPLLNRLAGVIERKKSDMSLQALQSVIIELYTNRAFRAAVQKNESLLDDHRLTSEERAAAAGLVAMKREVDSFAADLFEKTFRYYWNHFATIKRYFQVAEPEAFRLYCERYDFVDRGWMNNVERFGTILRACAEQGRVVLPPCFPDAVRYDVALLRAATAPLSADQLADVNRTPLGTPAFEGLQQFATGPAVELVRFDYDIPTLYTGTPPSDLVRRPRTFGFVPSRDSADGVAFALAPAMELIIDRARAGSTLEDLVTAAADASGVPLETPGFREACVRGVKNLFERGLLVPAGPGAEAQKH